MIFFQEQHIRHATCISPINWASLRFGLVMYGVCDKETHTQLNVAL